MWNAGIVLSRETLYERIWGYDFETSLALARRLHRLPARQARSGRRAAPRPDRPRRRVRGPRAVTLRWRIALILAAVALGVGAFGGDRVVPEHRVAAAFGHRRDVEEPGRGVIAHDSRTTRAARRRAR